MGCIAQTTSAGSRRVRILPASGTLLVSTDLHGNLADLRAMTAIFRSCLERDSATQWVILGDSVHGPSASAASLRPSLYGYVDHSAQVVSELAGLAERHPGRLHYVLGNHDHGHIGGRHTAKFHDDEVEVLERQLSEADRARMRSLFEAALLAVVAPCGLLLTHGAPDDSLTDLADLDAVDWRPERNDAYHADLLESFLWHYGQQCDTTAHLLEAASRGLDWELTVNVHGHDRDESGWYTDYGNQACPVIFGAPPEAKRYLRVDLAGSYEAAEDLRLDHEVLRLHPEAEPGDRADTRRLRDAGDVGAAADGR